MIRRKYTDMVDVIPPGRSGNVEVRHFEVSSTDVQFAKLRDAMNRHRAPQFSRFVAGRYAQLLVKGNVMMSTTPDELHGNEPLLTYARGNVLIAGLGLGTVLEPVLAKERVTNVVVVEENANVITLVQAPLVKFLNRVGIGGRYKLVHCDIFKYEPFFGMKFDTIWFDIWPDVDSDVIIPQARELRKRFKRSLAPDGWMGVWKEDEIRRARRAELRRSSF